MFKEVGEIVDGGHERDADAHLLNRHFAYEEVAALHMIHLGMVLGVVRRVASTGVVPKASVTDSRCDFSSLNTNPNLVVKDG